MTMSNLQVNQLGGTRTKWHDFLTRMKGKGYSMTELSQLYKKDRTSQSSTTQKSKPKNKLTGEGGKNTKYGILFYMRLEPSLRNKTDNFIEEMTYAVEDKLKNIIQTKFEIQVSYSQADVDDLKEVYCDFTLQGPCNNMIRFINAVIEHDIKFSYKGIKVISDTAKRVRPIM